MNLASSTSFGKVIYHGLPAITLPSLDGSTWYGTKHQQSQKFIEFFTLYSFSGGNPFMEDFPGIASFPNIYYTTNGVGSGYGFSGVVVVSRQKRIGFVMSQAAGSDTALRASVGSFTSNSRITKATTQGVIEPAVRIRFDAVKQP